MLLIKGKTVGAGKPLICVPVMEAEREAITAQVQKLTEDGCEMIEWRVDAFAHADSLNAVREVLDDLKHIAEHTLLVFTFRSANQGGLMQLPKEQIADLHQVAAESGAVDFVDVEFFENKLAMLEIRRLQKLGVHVIASHHDFGQTPDNEVMQMLLERMGASGTDVVKLAVMPQDTSDVLRLLQVTEQFHAEYSNQPLITMSMGKLGQISRISGATFGSCVTFGAAEEASAPGQIEYHDLAHILDALYGQEEQEKQ